MTWESLTDGLEAHDLLPAYGCHLPFLTVNMSVLKLSRSEASPSRGPAVRVSVLPPFT